MKQYFKGWKDIDNWMAIAYGIGQSFSFSIWLGFGMLLLNSYGVDVSSKGFLTAYLIGAIGTYYYGIRSYEQKVKK